MSRTLGAPLGGTTRGGHHGFESVAVWLITPPNLGGGGGICFPLMVVVASACPNVPVTCCAEAVLPPTKKIAMTSVPKAKLRLPDRKFIRCLLASRAGLFSQGVGCDESVPLPGSEEYMSRMNRRATPQCS